MDLLQRDPNARPSVREILLSPFVYAKARALAVMLPPEIVAEAHARQRLMRTCVGGACGVARGLLGEEAGSEGRSSIVCQIGRAHV